MKYTSFLRLPRIILMEDESFSAVSEYLSENHVSEVTFFDCFVHSVHKMKYYEEFAERFSEKAPLLRKRGIRVGINHLTTLGFFYQGGDVIDRELPPKVNENGNVHVGSICRSHPKCREYIEQTYTLLAKANPDFLYVDDDINFNRESVCYCPNCVARFEEETGIFTKQGLPADFEHLKQLMAAQPEVLFSYIDFNKRLAGEIYTLIEKTVHKICPGLELGLMTYGGPFLKSEIECWTSALKGDCGTIRFRPGGGLYTDESIDELFRKMSSVAIQNEYLPPYVDKIQAELECYGPCQAKSLKYLEFECLTYLAVGCNGIAYSLVNNTSPSQEYRIEFKNRWNVMQKIDSFGEKMINDIGNMPLSGIYSFVEPHKDGNYMTKWKKVSGCSPSLHYAGLPMVYRSDAASVHYINGEIVRELSDEVIPLIFEKPTYMTGEAAYLLNERGFSAYTGCKEIVCYREDTKKFIDCDTLCGVGLSKIDCELDNLQAFYHYPSYSMTLENDGVALAHLINFCGDALGICTVETKNSFGQKVVIDGNSEFKGADPFVQKLLKRQLFSYLSEDIDFCLSPGKITIFERKDESKTAVTVLNPSYDAETDIEIQIRKPISGFSDFVYYEDGEEKHLELKANYEKNTICIPKLPYMTLGYFTYQT